MKQLLILCFLITTTLNAQVGIGTTTPQGALDVTSNTLGFIVPRVVDYRAVTSADGSNPKNGTIVYDTTSHKLMFYIEGSWISIGKNTAGDTAEINMETASLFSNIDLQSLATLDITEPATLYGNSNRFTQVPGAPNYYIGRQFNVSGNPNDKQGLMLNTLDRNTGAFTKVKDLLVPGTIIADGFRIYAAYDSHAAVYEGKVWLAFECFMESLGETRTTVDNQNTISSSASSCIACLDTENWEIDPSTVSVVVKGYDNGTNFYSSSVPKLLNYKGKLYFYYTVVKGVSGQGAESFISTSAYGVELERETVGRRRIWVKNESTGIFANDTQAINVLIERSDNTTLNVADISDIQTDGEKIIAVSHLSVHNDCAFPLARPDGCFNIGFSETTNSLSANTFGGFNLTKDDALYNSPSEYPTFIQDVSVTNSLSMIASFVHNDGTPYPRDTFKFFENIANFTIEQHTINAIPNYPSGIGIIGLGKGLASGGSVTSPNGLYRLDMQTDGNLVLYDLTGGNQVSLWSSGTSVSGAQFELQRSNNMVVVDQSNATLWSSETIGRGAVELRIKDDGDMALYDLDNNLVWSRFEVLPDPWVLALGGVMVSGSSLISENGLYILNMQTDGNLVLYDLTNGTSNATALWVTNTSGNVAQFEFQSDGNLVVSSQNNSALWTSATENLGGVELRLQNDGNLVLYDINDNSVWTR